jgi:hypothetical protein
MDWSRLLETVATTTVPILLYMWANRSRAKREAEKKAVAVQDTLENTSRDLERKQDERHRQNQEALGEINSKLTYFPPHIHLESEGPLEAKGIRYVPKRNGR